MSNSQVFNFADLFKTVSGNLEYAETVLVSKMSICSDVASPQNSKITCEFVEGINNGDFGILKNSLGETIVFKILTKDYDGTAGMDLTVVTWIDVCEFEARIDASEAGTVLIEDMAGSIQGIVDSYETNGGILIPYSGTSDAITNHYKQIDPAKLYPIPEFLREVINTGNYTVKVRYLNQKIDFQALYIDDPTIHRLNLKDLNIFNSYEVQMSDTEYNILKVYVSEQAYAVWYYRIKQDGTVEQLTNVATGESKVINEDGTYGATMTWTSDSIAQERTASIIEKGDADLATARAAVGRQVYSKLREQYYNHEITAVANLDNDKMDLSDLDGLFSRNVHLYLDGQEIRTKITRYEYDGGNTIVLKFGNARMALTDKLKKKGII